MKKGSVLAPLAACLLLCGLACQKSGRSTDERASTNAANAPAGAPAAAASPQQPSVPQTHLKVGDRAPDFELTDTEGQKVRLSDFRGKKNVVLAFYVLAFTGG